MMLRQVREDEGTRKEGLALARPASAPDHAAVASRIGGDPAGRQPQQDPLHAVREGHIAVAALRILQRQRRGAWA